MYAKPKGVIKWENSEIVSCVSTPRNEGPRIMPASRYPDILGSLILLASSPPAKPATEAMPREVIVVTIKLFSSISPFRSMRDRFHITRYGNRLIQLPIVTWIHCWKIVSRRDKYSVV